MEGQSREPVTDSHRLSAQGAQRAMRSAFFLTLGSQCQSLRSWQQSFICMPYACTVYDTLQIPCVSVAKYGVCAHTQYNVFLL